MILPTNTERLRLRLFEEDDAEAYLAIASQPRVMWGHAQERPPTLDEMKEGIVKRNALWRKRGFCRGAVIELETGLLIGSVGLSTIADTDEVEVVWTMSVESRNKGYATEAAREWLHHGLTGVGLDVIVALANPDNIASIRVMEKLNMRPVGLKGTYYGRELMVFEADREWLEMDL
jgi:ribosomal-protein-alanine N-acetyltransferase